MNEEETEVFLTTAIGMGQFKTQMHEEILELLNLWYQKLCVMTVNVSNECDCIFYLLLHILMFHNY